MVAEEIMDSETGVVTAIPTVNGAAAPERASQAMPMMPFPCSSQTDQIWPALLSFQKVVEPPERNKTAKVKGRTKDGRDFEYTYKYATLDEIHTKVREPLAENDLGYQDFIVYRGAAPQVRTVLFHATSGQWIYNDFPVQPTEPGAQKFASAVSAARRYNLTLITGLAPVDEDDDANVADSTGAEIGAGKSTPASRTAKSGSTKSSPAISASNVTRKTDLPPPSGAPARRSPSDMAEGAPQGTPREVVDFVSRPSYLVDHKKGTWSKWESFILLNADHMWTWPQLSKLLTDNTGEIEEFFKADLVDGVAENFKVRIAKNAQRLGGESPL